MNAHFLGAQVPVGCSRRDSHAASIMVEINRSLEADETKATPLKEFVAVRDRIMMCCARAGAKLP